MLKLHTVFLLFLFFNVANAAAVEDARSDAESEWFYVVKTEPSDPAREAEFNAWYDDIDIPDVLAVPGFRRARRAVGQEIPEFPEVRLQEGDGKYVALYDIATRDIDKSIIDLYVAARKMNALSRSTDALRVVEANYYHRLLAYDFPAAGTDTGDRYFYIQKIICCRGKTANTQYRNWFDNKHIAKLRDAEGMVGTSLYELYRIMEELAVAEDEIPHMLAVYEIEAESAMIALSELQKAIENFEVSGRPDNLREVRDSILYVQMSDVRSN